MGHGRAPIPPPGRGVDVIFFTAEFANVLAAETLVAEASSAVRFGTNFRKDHFFGAADSAVIKFLFAVAAAPSAFVVLVVRFSGLRFFFLSIIAANAAEGETAVSACTSGAAGLAGVAGIAGTASVGAARAAGATGATDGCRRGTSIDFHSYFISSVMMGGRFVMRREASLHYMKLD
jgi:hypothetical protein